MYIVHTKQWDSDVQYFINVIDFFVKGSYQLEDATCLSYTSLAVTASSTAKPDKKEKTHTKITYLYALSA